MKEQVDKNLDSADEMQKEMHNFINILSGMKGAEKLTYDSMQATFIIIKIADLQKRIIRLEEMISNWVKNN